MMSNPEGELARVERLPEAWRDLIEAAKEARERAYAPYSQFPVGAALRTKSGRVFTGVNIENASSGLTVCAERVALWKAVSEGERSFDALAVVTDVGATPCGACRQVLAEFVADIPVLVANLMGDVWVLSQAQLLPLDFPRQSLQILLRGGESGEPLPE